MRVILEVTSGPSAGRKMRLATGQELRVGRTEWADFSLAEDTRMSAVHFALQAEAAACYLADLGSSNGTLVNGQPVTDRTRLADGDEIMAGDTRFVTRVEDEHLEGAPRAAAIAAASPTAPAALSTQAAALPAAPRRKAAQARFTVETCASGLTLCRGAVEELAPAVLAARIGEQLPPHLLVDFRKMGSPPPEDLAGRQYLFAWLDPAAAEFASPLVVAATDTGQWQKLIEAGWGNDSVVCFFSRLDRELLLDHFRRVARVKGQGERAGGVLGYCWPSVMAMLLAHGPPTMVRTLLAGIDAVLVEMPDLPETWQVYGERRVAEMIEKLGLVRQAAEAAVAGAVPDHSH